MAVFTIEEVVEATGGHLIGTFDKETSFTDVSTDTRTIGKGNLFLALEGANFDGHAFIDKACEKGAIAALVTEGKEIAGFPCIAVANTLIAYQALARYHRRRFNIPVVAVTGSSGKTTTKEMIAAVLATKYKVLKTEKNFNNEIGLPKTLLQLAPDHEACVVEMGMRGLGQIKELADIAEPTIGVVTNVGTSHIELLGSQDKIADAKAELVEAIGAEGTVILNADDKRVCAMKERTQARPIFYGLQGKEATVYASNLRYKKDGIKFSCRNFDDVFDVFLPMIGEHNVYDALAAIAVGRVLRVPDYKISKGLGSFTGMPMRQELLTLGDIVVFNDAYNANPSSMAESIKALGQLDSKRKIAMLGDMLELGDFTKEGHRQVGELLGKEGYDAVFTFGQASKEISLAARTAGVPIVKHCDSQLDMVDAYMSIHQAGDCLLIKGSRGLRMERLIDELREGLV